MTGKPSTLWGSLCLVMIVLVGFSTAGRAEEVDAERLHTQRVHKVIIDCEAGDDEDCQERIRVETLEDGTHTVHVDDHEMTWIEAGHGGAHHYTIGSEYRGQGGFLGVQLTDLTPELRQHFGVAADEGVMVAKVVDDSAAFRAGLAAGDIITRVDSETVHSSADLSHAIRSLEEGDTVSLEIWRQGGLETVSATLDKNEQLARLRRHVEIDCGEGEEDCGAFFIAGGHAALDLECSDEEACEVKIDCNDGDCECTVNGDPVDCQELHTPHGHGD